MVLGSMAPAVVVLLATIPVTSSALFDIGQRSALARVPPMDLAGGSVLATVALCWPRRAPGVAGPESGLPAPRGLILLCTSPCVAAMLSVLPHFCLRWVVLRVREECRRGFALVRAGAGVCKLVPQRRDVVVAHA
jgi:hypothetical protein